MYRILLVKSGVKKLFETKCHIGVNNTLLQQQQQQQQMAVSYEILFPKRSKSIHHGCLQCVQIQVRTRNKKNGRMIVSLNKRA